MLRIDTEIVKINAAAPDGGAISRAAEIIRRGGLVAFPTETVYGLGADGLNPDACAAIYAAKNRPGDNPLILHVADMAGAEKLAAIPDLARPILDKFWPGPLTIILNKHIWISDKITRGMGTIALRVPENNIARALINAANTPIAAPSANTSGRPSPTRAEHVAEDLGGIIPMILDGGSCACGLESTVVDFTRPAPIILRPGAITREMLADIIGEIDVFSKILDDTETPAAPGMKYRHYAPRGKITIIEGDSAVNRINALATQTPGKPRIFATTQTAHHYPPEITVIMGDKNNPATIAENLFTILRDCDTDKIEHIFAESIPENGIGAAIMNRLKKAAGHR
ncbi:MAG: L-threonylcarbamoyladenylate synthase [Defluviitaleaceae bacterium]|nr:L-threonylcarbamoyladenylate synthase [Defluviitaleaceae bacterium]